MDPKENQASESPFWVTAMFIREAMCTGRWDDLPAHEGGRNRTIAQAKQSAHDYIAEQMKKYNETVICRIQDDEYNLVEYVFPKQEG